MEEEFISEEQISTGKIYKDKAIYVATFLGGPLVAGYLIANNFKVFNDQGKVKKTWIYTIIATIIIFIGAYFLSNFDKIPIPRILLPLIYTAIASSLVKSYQGEKINSFLDSGGLTYGWWRTILISIIGLVVTLGFVLLIAFSTTFFTPRLKSYSDVKSYGATKSEIYFNNKKISDNEIDKIAMAFTKTGFFNNKQKKAAYVKKDGNDIDISLVVKTIENKNRLFSGIATFRDQLQGLLPKHKIVIIIVKDNIDNVIKRFE